MLMYIDSNIMWGLVGTIVILILALVIGYMKIKREAPEAFVLMKARAKKIPVIMMHYPNNVTRLVFPQLESRVEDIANYFKADGIYKFWDASGQNYERLNGDITLYHVLSNVPETVNHKIAAMLSQVEAYLKNEGHSIEGIQDLFFYVIAELEKEESDGEKKTLAKILKSINIDDIETKDRLEAAINFLQEHKEELEKLTPYFRSVPFSFQSMIRSWDNLMAFTSKNFAQAKVIIEMAVRRENQYTTSQVLLYAFGTVIVLAGLVFVFKAMGWA